MRLSELNEAQVLTEFKFTALKNWLDTAKEFLSTSNKANKELADYGVEKDDKLAGNVSGKLYGRTDPVMLKSNQAFMRELKKFVNTYGATEAEVFSIIRGESAFNTHAFNSRSGAMGLFQWMPKVATELNTSSRGIYKMSADEQMALYNKYAAKWTDNGRNKLTGKLGMLQAAPALISKPDNYVVYKKGSEPWEQNKVWRPASGGDITAGSIAAYYRKNVA